MTKQARSLARKSKGHTGLLNYYIHINGINTLAHSITYFGLFPKTSINMRNLAPTMFAASVYINTQDQLSRQNHKSDYNEISCDLGLATHTGRELPKALFPSSGQMISLWLPFNLYYMNLVRANTHTMGSILLSVKRYFYGSNIANAEAPIYVISLKKKEKSAHHIENIKDLAIVNPTASILYDKQHLAHMLFVFKENQINESEPLKLIKNLSVWWLNAGSVKLYPQDQPKKASRRSIGTIARH